MRIIIAENEVIIAESLIMVLEILGHTVLQPAYSGKEAVQLSLVLNPDILILDISLETKTAGIQACAELRTRGFTAPIILMSAYREDMFTQELQNLQYNGYIDKMNFDQEIKQYLTGDNPT
ncbi:response regulator [bacterium]|nr:response regulator [bacterium]